MKAIFSFLENSHALRPQSIELAALSNFYAQKQGFKTIFFGDDDSLKKFGNIQYNEKLKLNKDLYNIPKCFWSASKLIALSMMEESCIHIDMDLLLTRPIPNNFLKNDIVCFHNEFFLQGERYEKIKNLFNIFPDNCESMIGNSYNCGIIGGNDLYSIKRGIKILFDFISLHSDYIDEINTKNQSSLSTGVMIEQVWLFQIFKSLNKDISCLLGINDFKENYSKMCCETGYIHFILDLKLKFQNQIRQIIEKNNIKY